MSKRRFFNKNQVTAGLSPCLQVDVQPTTPLAVRVPPSEFVSGDILSAMVMRKYEITRTVFEQIKVELSGKTKGA